MRCIEFDRFSVLALTFDLSSSTQLVVKVLYNNRWTTESQSQECVTRSSESSDGQAMSKRRCLSDCACFVDFSLQRSALSSISFRHRQSRRYKLRISSSNFSANNPQKSMVSYLPFLLRRLCSYILLVTGLLRLVLHYSSIEDREPWRPSSSINLS